jgi:putative ABC transport system permease protein
VKQSGPGLDSPSLEIVGVAGDVKYAGLQFDHEPVYYRPFAQTVSVRPYLVVRSQLGASLVSALRHEIQSFDKDMVIMQVRTMDDAVAESIAQPRFRMLLLSTFACVALLLAATGVYGVMAYSVAQRTHEVGLRLALGAARGDVLRLVLGQAAWLALAGIGVGIAGALALTRSMSTLLFRVEPTDPITFTGVAVALAAIALLASFLPARRALRIDPMVALRHD